MSDGHRGTDGKRRRPLPADELVNELRPHGRGLAWLRWLVFWRIGAGNVVAYTAIALALVVTDARLSDQASTTTTALCALRHDLEQRVHDSDTFLRQHPEGVPGIPAVTIRQSSNGQRRTITALSGLRCSP